MIPVCCGSIWGLAAYFPCAPRPKSDQYLRKSLLDEFNLTVEDNLYIAPYFYEKSENGTVEIYLPSFLSIVIDSILINISIATAFYFGFKCYSTLRKSKDMASSQQYKSLQTQLFYSLVTQTLIPVFLMHIPAFAMFILTFLEVDVGPLSGIVTVTIALFPAIDPLPTLIIVKSYRNAIQSYLVLFLNAIARCIAPGAISTHPSHVRTV
ncbi:hypothetical protein L3Y34_006374 [Caenorhabditis briggsae]|uniref:Seven TM Receptor n=1 Tax=Caenorhabditis briggsae TaxID=6238 RepID=A0AAE9CZB1_CAEBR|nr:hypothetical protein L3Y34_006374 [Caenorhabditis briggsae]